MSLPLLKYIRDSQPTEEELAEWLGTSELGRYHTLRKAGLLVVQDGRVALSPCYLSPDGRHFDYENRTFNLDSNSIQIVCRGRP